MKWFDEKFYACGEFYRLRKQNPFPDFVWWWLLDPEESAEDQLQFNIGYFKKHVVLNKEEICELRTKLLNIHQCFILEHNGAWKPWWCQQLCQQEYGVSKFAHVCIYLLP